MPRRAKALVRLTAVGLLALDLGACASVGSTRRPPTAADSLVALTLLNETLVNHTRHILERDVNRRLSLGARLDRLPALYAETRREDARYAHSVSQDLESIWYEALGQDDYITLRAVHWELETEVEAPVYRSLDFSAVVPGASPMPAIARSLAQHPIEETRDVERYFYLLDNLGFFFAEVRASLAEQARKGVRIPRTALDSIATFLRAFRQPGSVSPFALSAYGLAHIDSASRPAVAAAIAQRIDEAVNVQIDSLVAYLTGAYASAPNERVPAEVLGLAQYPGGREYYQYLLRRNTTLDVEPRDLYTYGVREVERIRAAMAALRGRLGFSGSDSAFREVLRADVRNRIVSPNDFEARVRGALATLRDTLRARMGITVLDSVRLQARSAGVFDGARVVRLFESDAMDSTNRLEYVSDRVTRLPAYVIPALVARELVPGRFTLVSAIWQSDSLPTLRQLMRFPGPLDGWGEYARGLAGELGLYGDSLYAYGALLLELETTARMVTDVGVHYFGWPQSEAVRYLREYSVDAGTAGSDVLRIALAEPAYAVAAKVGGRELAGLRAWVRRELGAAFDDAAFQREILRVGVLPLPILSQHLAWWVWKIKSTEQGARSK